jgi:cardiolipin synthase
MAWLLAIILIPYLGVPLYLLLGGRKIKRITKEKERVTKKSLIREERPQTYGSDVEQVLVSAGNPASHKGNKIEALHSGEEAYNALLRLISEARHSVSINTFIFGRDEVALSIRDILCKRALEGIEVRLLLDGLGSFWTYFTWMRPLRKSGAKVALFLPMFPYRRKWSANLRNHRKIWICDNRKVILGGRNLAAEYLGPKNSNEPWADFNICLEGPSTRDLIKVFNYDWAYATGEELTLPDTPDTQFSDNVSVQVVASGPDTDGNSLLQGVLCGILEAKWRVWIVTPYFVPDDVIVHALTLAAHLGRDIKILVPKKSNHPVTDLVRSSYLRELSKAGVKCFAYEPTMMHTKLILIDDKISIVGSANLDLRSLYVNYEIASFIYNENFSNQISIHIQGLLGKSVPMVFQESHLVKEKIKLWFEDASRLLAPLL